MNEKAIPRIRISSIEPNELTDDIIEFATDNTRLCDHFHIPLQSGDDDILKKMRRPYTTDFFKNLIGKINKKLPMASLGLDVIAGFPGETKDHFENTYSFIKDLNISYLHVFPYSPRKGTKAYEFSDKVNNKEIKSRCALLRKLSNEKKRKFEGRMINNKFKAVIQTKRDRKTNLLKATTTNYLSVLVEEENDLKGKIVDIIPIKWDENNALHGIVN
jgi:threonylcarbamoyladenosine tRNA methylthiotransferase MtaB